MIDIPESHLDILQSRALAYLATIGPKGEPRVSALWFMWDGTSLLFSMTKKRQKYRNLLDRPQVSVALADPANPYRSMEIRGRVKAIKDDPDHRLGNALSQKYLQRDVAPEEKQPGEERVIVSVEPEQVSVFPFQGTKK